MAKKKEVKASAVKKPVKKAVKKKTPALTGSAAPKDMM